MDENIIVIENENGTKSFTKLAEFESDITNKMYVMFTDDSLDNENLNIYCSIINTDENGNVLFKDLEDDLDKEECQKAIDLYLNEI